MRERSLLGNFARVAYDCTRRFFQAQFPEVQGVPYFVSSMHTWGDQVNVHPHNHSICSCGIKSKDGVFHPVPEETDISPLEEMFRHGILDMLRKKKRITEKTKRTLLSWNHSGFSCNSSVACRAGDRRGLERIAGYVLRPPLSLKRLTYCLESSKVIYRGRYNPSTKRNFTALDCKEFLCLLLSHVPHKWEVLIRYYGAAASCERREESNREEPLLEEKSSYTKKRKSSWSRMIHRIYGIDPLKCPKSHSDMKVIAFIKDPEVIEKILRHLEIWDPPRGPPFDPPVAETEYDYNFFDHGPPI